MEIEHANHIASISSHFGLVHHLSFKASLLRPGFARWVEDSSSKTERSDGIRMWFAYARQLAKLNRLYFPRLIWVLREERGRGGRYHMHAITGGWLNPSACSELWKWGRAVVTPFFSDGNIGDYIAKCLGSEIEARRFSGRENDLSVTFSEPALKLINCLIRHSRQDIEDGAGSNKG